MNTKLTEREKQILTLVGKGFGSKEIAYKLNLAEQTVKNHLWNAHRELDCSTTAGALVKCLKMGLITLEDC
jgi:DNA-binding NarL/FixJ family response regulator